MKSRIISIIFAIIIVLCLLMFVIWSIYQNNFFIAIVALILSIPTIIFATRLVIWLFRDDTKHHK
jgi:hypothetical protein